MGFTGKYRDKHQAPVRGVPSAEPGAGPDLLKPITYTETAPDRRCLDVCVPEGVAVSAPSVQGPIRITGETVTATSAAFPTAANQTDRQAISIRNVDAANSVYIVNTVSSTFAAEDPDIWEIGPDETFNIDMDDTNKIILVCEAGQTADIQIMEIRQ